MEDSSLMRSMFKISEYVVWSRSNEHDTRVEKVKHNNANVALTIYLVEIGN